MCICGKSPSPEYKSSPDLYFGRDFMPLWGLFVLGAFIFKVWILFKSICIYLQRFRFGKIFGATCVSFWWRVQLHVFTIGINYFGFHLEMSPNHRPPAPGGWAASMKSRTAAGVGSGTGPGTHSERRTRRRNRRGRIAPAGRGK